MVESGQAFAIKQGSCRGEDMQSWGCRASRTSCSQARQQLAGRSNTNPEAAQAPGKYMGAAAESS